MSKSMTRMIRIFTFTICIAITVFRVNYAIAVTPPEDIDEVTKLAEFRPGGGKKNLDRLLETFEKKAAADPYINWLKVKPLLESPDVLPAVKSTIFHVVLETADAATVKSIVAAAAQWCSLTNQSIQTPPQSGNPSLLCNALLETMVANEEWRSWAVAEPTLSALLMNLGATALVNILPGLALDTAVKSQIAEGVILRKSNGGLDNGMGSGNGLYSFLTDDSISRIREALRLSIKGDGYLHFGAVQALVEIGDLATLPILENPAEIRASLPPRRADAWIELWTKQIKLQHPPSQLLQWIADPARATNNGTASMALWAMQRASALGMDPDLIRLAVLQFADNARHTHAAIALPLMKEIAMNLGVLHTDDLKDVEVPDYSIFSYGRIESADFALPR